MSVKHVNNGSCPRCLEIINKYPSFNEDLRKWFLALQALRPEAHTSCAGRGKDDQEAYFKQGTSRAHWGQSAHNYNLAIDVFKLSQAGAEWPINWYQTVVVPSAEAAGLESASKWTTFREWPHFQVKNWKSVVTAGKAKLVE
jgi:hypothetical protein